MWANFLQKEPYEGTYEQYSCHAPGNSLTKSEIKMMEFERNYHMLITCLSLFSNETLLTIVSFDWYFLVLILGALYYNLSSIIFNSHCWRLKPQVKLK